ncbi:MULTISPECIES: hypothetical protein [unclassified Streptomyces]|uniref:hypothetical protein n=1 Tax=unclassified Streptomyces TaxID=2593676 RepID=UPI0004C74CEF|nr:MULTISPECIES: hypothetical protein [unclassified Streptomyces]KOV81859.1 hypothetical protein ADL02_22460 [Streptomyces sp. NRRL WC-3723]
MTRLRQPDPSVPASRRSLRRQRVAEPRAHGRYGPELREVLPSLVGLGLVPVALVLLAGRLSRAFWTPGLLVCAVLLMPAATVGLRLRRGVLRRRRGRYTTQELARLSDRGLVEATTRMLERDGWRVADLSLRAGRRRLYARDVHGRELDVSFRTAASADEDTRRPATVRETVRPGEVRPGRLIVHRGDFSRAEVRWAARQTDVHLVDGHRLRRWAAGMPLDRLGQRR